ncbi:hypothetical protein LTR53_011378 [Teratosphaeriaceae sp. CCFEE 6253]|nr:hypothetical protein LTR53_011378 [Teratosphaeriaceae sp. CCFEE 6253]
MPTATFLGSAICHCTTCRKYTSSTFSVSAVTTAAAFHLKSGTPRTHGIVGDNGVPSTLYFCGDCGSTMWIEYGPKPDLRIVKAGVLDGDDALEHVQPLFEQYTKRRAPWLRPVIGAEQFEGMRDAEHRDQESAGVTSQHEPKE